MTANLWTWTLLLCAFAAQSSLAAPILTVTPGGLNAGNREWFVDIAADPSLFSGGGGSMANELAFSVDDPVDLLNVEVGDAAIWDTPNPGNNPFTGTETDGIYIDFVNDNSFAAYGSAVVTSGDPTQFLKITTAGPGLTTLRYGTAASGDPNKGNLIAQAGQTFSGYTGVVSVPEPATALLTVMGILCIPACFRSRCRG